MSTPLIPEAFETGLSTHPNRAYAEYVVAGLRHGFDTGVDCPEEAVHHDPLKSATDHPEVIDKWFAEEVGKGRMGVSNQPPHKYTRVAPVGTVPKRSYTGELKFRVISHLSKESPPGAGDSINDMTDTENFRVEMASVWDAAEIVAAYGSAAHMTKTDCRNGYRVLPAHPEVYHTQVYFWKGKFYTDYAVCFGNTSSAAIYDSVSSAMHYIVQNKIDAALGLRADGARWATVLHYLDDFLIVGANGAVTAAASKILFDTMATLGVPLASEKTETVVQAAEYLGLWIDCRAQTISLPQGKRKALLAELRQLRGHAPASVPRKRMEPLLGRVTHAHAVLPWSRPHVHALLVAVHHQPHQFGQCKINSAVWADLSHWISVLETAAGRPRPLATRPSRLSAAPGEPQFGGENRNWAIGGASGEWGFGYFAAATVTTVPWSPEERASATLAVKDGDKNSSTLQELKVLAAATLEWVHTRNPDPGALFTYGTGAANLTHLTARLRSNTGAVNRVLAGLGRVLGPRGLHVRVVWRARTHLSSRAADCLSRGDVRAFQALLPGHPAKASTIRASTLATIRA